MKVTEIKKVGSGKRYKVSIDDQTIGTIEDEILAKFQLRTGQEVDEEFLQKLTTANGDFACFNRSLSLLEKTMKSEKMLRDYLREKGYPKACINKAIDKLCEYGYIDDKLYSENYIRSYQSQKSRKKLKYDLLLKGIKEEIILEKLDEFFDEALEQSAAISIAKKYMKNKEFDLKNKQKFYHHFAGKGYDYALISNLWEELQNDRN